MTDGKLKIEIRRKKILEQLNRTGKVSVAELSAMLNVTPVTIRNDLTELEQEGCLLRVQGGAVKVIVTEEGRSFEGPVLRDIHGQQKASIARTVAAMVHDGDTLFLNSGTTCEYIAEALRMRKNLNIVTNALKVATKLGDVPTFRVLLIGGEINAQYGFTHGGDAQEQLGKYQADWAILSVDGVSAKGGVTTHHAEEAIIDRIMSAGAQKTIIAADGSKIGRAGFSRVAPCTSELILVTDSSADEEALEALCGQAVNTFLA